jgi:hypothetical protein
LVGSADRAVAQASAPGEVTFASIANARQRTWAEIRQTRSVLHVGGGTASNGGSGGSVPGLTWDSVNEALILAPDAPDGSPRFRLDFVGIPGQILDPIEQSQRAATHASQAGFLHQFGGFQIADPARAAQSYRIVPIDRRVRLSRPSIRVAVVPIRLGRSAWILELDAATHYPLYSAEVSSFGSIVGTLEVTSFTPTDPRSVDSVEWWEPSSLLRTYRSVSAAVASLDGAPRPILPEPTDLPEGFDFLQARTVLNDLRAESSLVLIYGDGVASIFVVETFGVPAPSLPSPVPGSGTKPYAVFFFHDHSSLQLMFQVGGVQTIVIGATGEFGVLSLTERLLERAVGVR